MDVKVSKRFSKRFNNKCCIVGFFNAIHFFKLGSFKFNCFKHFTDEETDKLININNENNLKKIEVLSFIHLIYQIKISYKLFKKECEKRFESFKEEMACIGCLLSFMILYENFDDIYDCMI